MESKSIYRKAKNITVVLGCCLVAGCRYDVKPNVVCDTTGVTYSGTITGIIRQYGCLAAGCHGSANSQAGFTLNNYAGLKAKVTDGRLFGAINHFSGYVPMPQNLGKMDQCDIDKIKVWINAGAPNN